MCARRIARACAARAQCTARSAQCGIHLRTLRPCILFEMRGLFGWCTLPRHRAPVLQARSSNLPSKWQATTLLQMGTRFYRSRWQGRTVLQAAEAPGWLPMTVLHSTRSAQRRFGFAKPSLPAIEGLFLGQPFAEPSFAAILGAFPRLPFANPAFTAMDATK